MGLSYNPETNIITLDDGSQLTFEDWVAKERPRTGAMEGQSEHDRMRAFFFGEPQAEPQTELLKQWKAEGKCPICGELGRIHLSTFVCSRHGVY